MYSERIYIGIKYILGTDTCIHGGVTLLARYVVTNREIIIYTFDSCFRYSSLGDNYVQQNGGSTEMSILAYFE